MIVRECPMLTADVIEAIDEELAYQNSLPSRRGEDGTPRADTQDHGVAGQLVTLKEYTDKALAAWTGQSGDEAALDVLRKCAAICCRALLLYGCPRRVG